MTMQVADPIGAATSDRTVRSWLGKTVSTALTGGTTLGAMPLWQRLFGVPALRARP